MEFQLSDGGRELLRGVLFDEYGSPDKRIKRLEKIPSFIVDDRTGRDHGADENLYSWFCTIAAEPLAGGDLRVTLEGNVPSSPGVASWIQRHGAALEGGVPSRLEFIVERGGQAKLRGLASAFRDIVAPGRRYSERSYKHVCPRTADSLERLQRVLDRAWSD